MSVALSCGGLLPELAAPGCGTLEEKAGACVYLIDVMRDAESRKVYRIAKIQLFNVDAAVGLDNILLRFGLQGREREIPPHRHPHLMKHEVTQRCTT